MADEIVMKAFIMFSCFRASYTIENSMSLSTSYHNELLILQCQVKNNECCQHAKIIEFKKNGRGVCYLENCNGEFVVPLTRDDAKYYRCFCPGSDLHRAHLLITEIRLSDYGSWTCECTDSGTDKVCNSNVRIVSEESTKEDIAPVLDNNETEYKIIIGFGVVVSIVTVFLIILAVVQCYLFRRVKIMFGNRHIRKFLEKGEEGTYSESQNLDSSTDMSRKSDDLLESKSLIQTRSIVHVVPDNPVWCICSECEEREEQSERVCCNRVECITLHKDFDTYCFKDIDGAIFSNSEKQRENRSQAYKNYNEWSHGIIVAEQGSIILPACSVGKIRRKYPDPMGQYRGLKQKLIFSGKKRL